MSASSLVIAARHRASCTYMYVQEALCLAAITKEETDKQEALEEGLNPTPGPMEYIFIYVRE
jgi:hypothetical protein